MSLIRIAQILRAPRRSLSKDAGFSLIEVVASLFIFTLLTLGLIPLLTSSIRASNGARGDTIGKNAALKAMERVRGLPFYVSYSTSTTKVDLLDLYFPDGDLAYPGGGNAGIVVVAGPRTLWRTQCTSTALGNPACPRDIPTDYTLTFEAQFVDVVAGGVQPTPGESATSYANVAPAANYAWNSTSTDIPPRQIVLMTITASWTVGQQSDSYTLTSLLSDRSFGGRKFKATATLSYGLDVYTAYDTKKGGTNFQSTGTGFVSTSDSDIEGQRLSTARQATTAGRAELEQAQGGGSLGTVDAATSTVLTAPPDASPGNITATERVLRHPDFVGTPVITAFGPTSVTGPVATALTALPQAVGDSNITGIIAGSTTDYFHTKDPQLNNEDFNSLNLFAGAAGDPPIVSLVANPVSGQTGLPGTPILPTISQPTMSGAIVAGGSRATSTATAVHSQATTGFDRMLLMRSNFIPNNSAPVLGGGTLSGTQGAIIIVDDFRAAVSCDSTAAGTGDAEGAYSATVYYWEDPTPNNVNTDGRYVPISLPAEASRLADVAAENSNNGPRVYDASGNNDIYLFGKTLGRATSGERSAYLSSWSALTAASEREDPSTDPTGAPLVSANASIDGAIEMETADLDRTRTVEGRLTFSLGSLSCFAEDSR